MGVKGVEYTLDSEKEGENQEKEENWEGSFTLLLLTYRTGYTIVQNTQKAASHNL